MKTIACALLLGASLVAISVSACSSTTETDASGDAGADDASTAKDASKADTGAEDAGTDAATGCNALVQKAPEATAATVKGSAPAGTGGTIADGTYFLTEFTVYDPNGTASAPSPSGLQITLKITGNLMESIQTLPGAEDTFAETFVVVGTALNRTLTCPKAGADLAATYTVSGGNLTIYETDPQSMNVAGSVYVKQ